MPMSNIELANYNQTTVPCKYCPSPVKRSKLPFHVVKCHKDELMKERAREKEIEKGQFPDPSSLVPERPVCLVVPTGDTENWDDSNYATYNPLLATAHKPIIRASYYLGFSKQDIKKCREFETARMAQIREGSANNFETSYQPEVFEPIPPPIDGNDSNSSEESWSESSISAYSMRPELSEESFQTCNNGDTNASTHENVNSFGTSVAEYMSNLSAEKKADVMKKFTKIMREN